MEHGTWEIGHGARDMEHWTWIMGHRAWGMEHGTNTSKHNPIGQFLRLICNLRMQKQSNGGFKFTNKAELNKIS